MIPDFVLISASRYDPQLLKSSANLHLWPNPSPTSSPFYLFPYHRERLLQAAKHFGWAKAVAALQGGDGFSRLLHEAEESLNMASPDPHGIRYTLSSEGDIAVTTDRPPQVPWENLVPARLPPPSSVASPKVSSMTGGALSIGPDDSAYGDPKKGQPWEAVVDTIRTTPSPYTLYKTTKRDVYDRARAAANIRHGDNKEVLIISSTDGAVMEGSITTVYLWRNGEWVTPSPESGGQIGSTRRWALDRGLCVESVVNVDSLVDGEECWLSNGKKGFIWAKIKL